MDNTTSNEKCTFLDVIHLKDISTAVFITAVSTAVVNCSTAITAIIGNSIFLFIFRKVPSLRTPSNVLLASLSVTDLIVGLIVQPTSVARRLLEANDRHNCPLRVTYAFFGFLCSGASFLNIGLIGLDRCFAICMPFWYESFSTTRTHTSLVVIIWLLWGVFTILPFAQVLSVSVYFIGVFTVLCTNILIVFICYAIIFRVILQKRNQLPPRMPLTFNNVRFASNGSIETPTNLRGSDNHLLSPSEQSTPDTPQKFNRDDASRAGSKDMRSSLNERRNTYTIGILILCMLVCYAPQLTILFMRGALGDNENLVFIADAWVDTITFINSSINPLIYCFRLTEIRNAVSRVFKRGTHPSSRSPKPRHSSVHQGIARSGISNSAVV